MKIRWFGHACFSLVNNQKKTLFTDPFDDHVGYPLPKGAANVVTISHLHGDHNYTNSLTGPFVRVDQPGEIEVCGFRITGIPSFHDDQGGIKRGKNTIFLIEADGLRIAHLGDLGHELSEEQIFALGRVDVLMIPVGGFYTIDAQTAVKITRSLNPAVTIPMHYLNHRLSFPITSEMPFLDQMGSYRDVAQQISLTPDSLASYAPVIRFPVP